MSQQPSGASDQRPGPRPGPLAGLLVADFSRVLAGPYWTMLLADLGAYVIKVESPAGDDTRHWVPPVTSEGLSTYFLAINRGKRSVALDLSAPGRSSRPCESPLDTPVRAEDLRCAVWLRWHGGNGWQM